MMRETDIVKKDPFLTLACQQEFLTAEQAEQLAREATSLGVRASRLATEKGLIAPDEAHRLETEVDLQVELPGYQLLEVLGRGAMGIVFRARQINLDRVVAIKTILVDHMDRSEIMARFENEARSVAKLRHPHIVTAYDFGRHSGKLFLVMELLEGEPLDKWIESQGSVPEATTWLLIRQAAAGLAHATQLGLVHRDVKPSNLFVVEPPLGLHLAPGVPLIKVTDFGLVFRPEGTDAGLRLTQTGMLLGTPLYMAPEQLTTSTVDHRADIYALGATALHMLSGEPPYAGKSYYEVLALKNSGTLPSFTSITNRVSPESLALLTDMLAANPRERISDYNQLIQRIDALPGVGSHLPSSTTIPIPQPSPARPPTRRRRPLVLTALLLVAALAGGFLWYNNAERDAPPPQAAPTRTMVPSGWEQNLFDGVNVGFPNWFILRGGWKSTPNVEGSQVIAGEGVIRRTLPPLKHYQLVLGVDLHRARSVSIQVGIRRTDKGRAVMRITQTEVVLGEQADTDAPFKPVSPPHEGPGRGEPNAPVFHEVRFERHGEHWWAFFQGKEVGHLRASPEQEAPEFLLQVEGGTAHFSDLTLVELVPPS